MAKPEMTIPPILLVGLGKMGGAMLAGWCERGLAPSVAVDPACPAAPDPKVTVVADATQIPAFAEPWFLAFNAQIELHPVMTPEDLAKAAPGIERAVGRFGK